MRISLAIVLFSSILIALGSAWPGTPAENQTVASSAQTLPKTWTTRIDPSGFSVNTPKGWAVVRDAQGRVTIGGLEGEQAVIWPMFVEQRQFNAAGASALVQQLARKIDSQIIWSARAPSQNVARAIAKGGPRSGAAMLTWAAGANGTEVFLYCVEAPAALYGSSTDTFVRILTSFHVMPDPGLKNVPAPEHLQDKTESSGATPVAISYVRWTDPHEGAFSLVVPQGWHVIGGAYRLSATDIRNGVTMMPPDGQIRIFVGDSNLGIYTEPTQVLAMGGLREGGHQTLGDGTNLEIRRYMTGQQFASAYAGRTLRRQCAGLQIQSNNARPDIATFFSQLARDEAMPGAQIAAGDVSFTCNLNGKSVVGKFVVGTILPSPGKSPMWFVYRIYGYIAPADRKPDAEKICLQAVDSWQINPQWEARESRAASTAVGQDNRSSQQIRSQAIEAIAKDQQETSDMITKGYPQRQQVYDEISRKRENAILGEVDVIDPQSGTHYKVDNYSDYHWMNNEGSHVGTQTDTSPGPDWHQLITLP